MAASSTCEAVSSNHSCRSPCWDYNDDDEVVSYEYNALHKSVDITDAVFKGGKIKTFVKPQLKVIWKRKGQGE